MNKTLFLNAGKYAVKFFHDKNNNGKIDLNWIGIPKESYGNSNNIQPIMGPPKFKDMIFELKDNLNLKMTIIN